MSNVYIYICGKGSARTWQQHRIMDQLYELETTLLTQQTRPEVECADNTYDYPYCIMAPDDDEQRDEDVPPYDYTRVYVPCHHRHRKDFDRCTGRCRLTELERETRDRVFETYVSTCGGSERRCHRWTSYYFDSVSGLMPCFRHVGEPGRHARCTRCGLVSWANLDAWIRDVFVKRGRVTRTGCGVHTRLTKRQRMRPNNKIVYEE